MVKLALVGKDVSQSSSHLIHRFILSQLGFDLDYTKVSVTPEQFERERDSYLSKFDGFNVTIPYKIAVMDILDSVQGDAQLFGAVNTVVCRDKSGHNTDGIGFQLMLQDEEISVVDRTVLVLGAGGAGRTVAIKLMSMGANVFIHDRHPEKLQAIHTQFSSITPVEEIEVKPYDIIINATGMGMHQTVGQSPVSAELLSQCQIAIDLIHSPSVSAFLQIAQAQGKRTLNGLAMLFYQAYYADCLFVGQTATLQQAKQFFIRYKESLS